MDRKAKIVIIASGAGSNAEEIIKYFQSHAFIEVVLVLSNNPEAYVLERARKFSIDAQVFNKTQFKDPDTMLALLEAKKVTHIVLAGFLWLIPEYLINAFPERIINIHPALLPKYGGKGMYGMKVHEAVRESNEKETGITIHIVDKKYDEGRILFQERCNVESADTSEQIARKVHLLEHTSYPRIIEQWIGNE